ncbi:MAG: DUF4402 domain-containing protein [Sphingomicrobium sp.]
MRFSVSLAAVAATLVAATPAAAQQAQATATAKGIVLQSLTLVRTADLDFGTVAPDVNNPGTVTINADTGARSTGGSVVALPGSFSRASFDGSGNAGNVVQLTLNQPAGAVISSGSNTVGAVLNLDSGGTSRVIPAGGTFTVNVGGVFSIAANQPSGLYSATFDLIANYQ